jgi:hypothetical protein
MTAEHGIIAASRALRHAGFYTTAQHYTDLKAIPGIVVGGLLDADMVAHFPSLQQWGEANARKDAK